MNICRDCKHFRHGSRFGGPRCFHPQLMGLPDPVYGFEHPAYARSEREAEGRCGPVGAYYEPAGKPKAEPKPNFLRRLFG